MKNQQVTEWRTEYPEFTRKEKAYFIAYKYRYPISLAVIGVVFVICYSIKYALYNIFFPDYYTTEIGRGVYHLYHHCDWCDWVSLGLMGLLFSTPVLIFFYTWWTYLNNRIFQIASCKHILQNLWYLPQFSGASYRLVQRPLSRLEKIGHLFTYPKEPFVYAEMKTKNIVLKTYTLLRFPTTHWIFPNWPDYHLYFWVRIPKGANEPRIYAKFSCDESYKKFTGISASAPLNQDEKLLKYLKDERIDVEIRSKGREKKIKLDVVNYGSPFPYKEDCKELMETLNKITEHLK